MSRQAFAQAVNRALLDAPKDRNFALIVHPRDCRLIEEHTNFDIHTRNHPVFIGSFHQNEQSLGSVYIHPRCPRGYVMLTTQAPIPGPSSVWDWPDLDEIARQWPDVDPELARYLYPRPAHTQPLSNAQRALLEAAIDKPAIAHYKSAVLRPILERGYARPIGKERGVYMTTDKGRRYLKRYKSVWTHIAEDDG